MIIQFDSKDRPNYLKSKNIAAFQVNPHQDPVRSRKRQDPNNKNSHSYEAPQLFIKPQTVIHEQTYNNPYISNRLTPGHKPELMRPMSSVNNFKYNKSGVKEESV